MFDSLLALFIFVLILSFLVFIHELGHFLTAKKFGIDVEEFGMGIPPRIWGVKRKGTMYSINALPFGGFVKIKGEDLTGYNPKDKTNFMNKKPWQRAVVLSAGIFMNLMVALGIFYFVLGTNGFKSNPMILLGDYSFKYGETVTLHNVINFIESGSPAEKAGVEFADQVISLSYEDQKAEPKTVEDIREFVKDKEGKTVTVMTKNINTGEVNEYQLQPYYSEQISAPALGVALGEAVYLSYQKPLDKILAGALHSMNVMDYSFYALKSMVSEVFRTKDVSGLSQGVAGPVGIFGAVKSVIQFGGNKTIMILFDLTALLSLSLAIMNLLPIPALDGGRLMFVIIEWVTGRKPSQKVEETAHKVGYAFLLALLVLITLKDIIQLF